MSALRVGVDRALDRLELFCAAVLLKRWLNPVACVPSETQKCEKFTNEQAGARVSERASAASAGVNRRGQAGVHTGAMWEDGDD